MNERYLSVECDPINLACACAYCVQELQLHSPVHPTRPYHEFNQLLQYENGGRPLSRTRHGTSFTTSPGRRPTKEVGFWAAVERFHSLHKRVSTTCEERVIRSATIEPMRTIEQCRRGGKQKIPNDNRPVQELGRWTALFRFETIRLLLAALFVE